MDLNKLKVKIKMNKNEKKKSRLKRINMDYNELKWFKSKD